MKVALCIRSNWKDSHGGDVTQMLSTKYELERLFGVEAHICDEPSALEIISPDIVHIFNIQTLYESYKYLEVAEKIGAKKVLSTIYWDLEHSTYISIIDKLGFTPGSKWIKHAFPIARKLIKLSAYFLGKPLREKKSYFLDEKKFLNRFDLLLPNSKEEYDILMMKYNINLPYEVVINAVNDRVFHHKRKEIKFDVMCAARIEPLKNQISVAKAIDILSKERGVNVLYVGGIGSLKYRNKLHKFCATSISSKIIDSSQSQEQLADYYASSKVHVLASFRDSPGLSSLEALASGCNIVVSEKNYCPILTYFSEVLNKHVFVCDPYSISSIKNAIEMALSSPTPENIDFPFLWSMAARQTYDGYKKAMSSYSF